MYSIDGITIWNGSNDEISVGNAQKSVGRRVGAMVGGVLVGFLVGDTIRTYAVGSRSVGATVRSVGWFVGEAVGGVIRVGCNVGPCFGTIPADIQASTKFSWGVLKHSE